MSIEHLVRTLTSRLVLVYCQNFGFFNEYTIQGLAYMLELPPLSLVRLNVHIVFALVPDQFINTTIYIIL